MTPPRAETDRIREDTVRRFYDADATYYEARRFTTRKGRAVDAVQERVLRDLLAHCGSGPLFILNAGAGTGRQSHTGLGLGHKVVDLDFSEEMLRLARSRLGEAGMRSFKGVKADIIQLPFPAAMFDVCMSINVLGHISQYRVALYEMGRVVKAGGYVLFNFPNLASVRYPVAMLINWRKKAIGRNVFSRWFALQDVEQTLAEAGLRIVGLRGQPSNLFLFLAGSEFARKSGWIKTVGRHPVFCPVLYVLARKAG